MPRLFSFASATAFALTLLAALPALPARAQSFDRALVCASGTGPYNWGPTQLTVDALGNTYVTGTFNGTITLGSVVLTATQTLPYYDFPSDNFVAKLDAAGNYVWAVQMADNQAAVLAGLAVDASGDVYVTGGFSSYSIRFGTNGLVLFNSSARGEAFVAKLSGSTGQWLWARRMGGVGDDELGTPVFTSTGTLCLLGYSGSATADAGPFTISGRQNFLAQLSPAGIWQQVRPLGYPDARINGLLLDAQDNLYLSGSFKAPSISFGTTTLTTQAVPGSPTLTHYDLFVAKANAAGTWLWAVQGDAVTHQNLAGAGSLATDGRGRLYLTGSYTNRSMRIGSTVLPNLSVQYPPPNPLPPVPYTNHYYPDAFVACLDTAGHWQWATRNGGAYYEAGRQVVADAQGRIYTLGFFNETGPAVSERQKIAQLDGATGAWRSYQSLAPVLVRALALDGQQRLSLAGSFDGPTAQFGSFTLAGAGTGSTGFIARQGPGPLATRSAAGGTAWQLWPNPSSAGVLVRVLGPGPGQPVELLDALGRRVRTRLMPAAGPLLLPTAGLPAGLYLLRSHGQAARLLVQ